MVIVLTAWKVATSALSFCIAVGPSVVTALNDYPKAQSKAKWFSALCDRASFLTHRDSPGTGKLPGTRSEAPEQG